MANPQSSAQDKGMAIAILAAFLLRLGFDLLGVNAFVSYAFEALIVLIAYRHYRERIPFEKPKRIEVYSFAGAFCAGYFIHRFGYFINVQLPINSLDPVAIILLLLLAPLLEEALYRLALWEAFKDILKSDKKVIFASAVIFSLSHFWAVVYAPQNFHTFIQYQTAYTFILGLVCGQRRMRGGMFAAYLVHFAFNLGFFTAYYL